MKIKRRHFDELRSRLLEAMNYCRERQGASVAHSDKEYWRGRIDGLAIAGIAFSDLQEELST